jgi:hypothetical protein
MKAVWILIVVIGIVLGCWLMLFGSTDSVVATPVVPDAAPVRESRFLESLTPPERSAAAVAPIVPPVNARSSPTEPRELTKEEVQAFEVPIQPGIIEGIVLRGREPLSTGGIIRYRRGDLYDMSNPSGELTLEEGTEQTNIDAHGLFRTEELQLGGYELGVDLGHGLEQEVRVNLLSPQARRRIVIVLGTTSASGHVWDDNGAPLKGALVAITMEFERKGAQNFRTTRATADDGSYSMQDLPAGHGWFTVQLTGRWRPNESDLMQRITLSSGEHRILDFGAPEPATKWSGALKNSAGDNIRGGARLHLTRVDSNAYSESKIMDDGTFTVLVRPGEYGVGVSLNSNWDHRIELPHVNIPSIDLDHDLIFPGTRITGVVIDEATGQPVDPKFELGIGVRMRNANNGGSGAKLDDNGRFVVDGIEPGVWLVSSWPIPLVEGDHEIIVSKQDVEIPLKLAVKTRK